MILLFFGGGGVHVAAFKSSPLKKNVIARHDTSNRLVIPNISIITGGVSLKASQENIFCNIKFQF